jgi:hypothetical protein
MNTIINEAKRYIDNAKEILREKANKEDGFYQDSKYVKMAGHTAYSGVLVALDYYFGKKTKGRKSVDWYKEHLRKEDKKTLNYFIAAYDTLHLALGYDGNPSAKIANTGLEYAEQIIDWVEMKTA